MTYLKRILAAGLAATALAVPAASASAAGTMAPTQNIVQTAAAAGQFKTLLKLATVAGLAGALEGPGKLTVFAPTDAAFAKVPKSTLAALLKNKAKLKAVLLYHVLNGEYRAAKVLKLSGAKTLQGKRVTFKVKGGSVYVNNAKVIKADVGASNGVIHVINSVLIP